MTSEGGASAPGEILTVCTGLGWRIPGYTKRAVEHENSGLLGTQHNEEPARAAHWQEDFRCCRKRIIPVVAAPKSCGFPHSVSQAIRVHGKNMVN